MAVARTTGKAFVGQATTAQEVPDIGRAAMALYFYCERQWATDYYDGVGPETGFVYPGDDVLQTATLTTPSCVAVVTLTAGDDRAATEISIVDAAVVEEEAGPATWKTDDLWTATSTAASENV